MRFWRSVPGALVLLALGVMAVAVGGTAVQVYRATHPQRHEEPAPDFRSMRLAVEEVRFASADELELSGWWLPGEPGRAAILLCHDRAASRGSLANLMIRLGRAGFGVLAFDFRGHGESAGNHSSLGVDEKRDVLGAIAFLSRRVEPAAIGAYGVGMGAHAVVLAAADRPSVRVLVLDGLYPDPGFPLARFTFAGWSPGARLLGFLPRSWLSVTSGGADRAADVLPRLLRRHLLLISPAGDARLAGEMQAMYERIPEQRDYDGNLVTLPALHTGPLYGADSDRYHERVASFFEQRLR